MSNSCLIEGRRVRYTNDELAFARMALEDVRPQATSNFNLRVSAARLLNSVIGCGIFHASDLIYIANNTPCQN